MKVPAQKKYQNHIPRSFTNKLVCVDDRFSKPIIFERGENAAYNFIKAVLKDYEYSKKSNKKLFNKNFIMTEEEQ